LLIAMLIQRQLPWGPITSLLGLPFSAYIGTCHKRVALQSELYPIPCLLLAIGVSSSDAVLECFAPRCMTGDHVPSAVASYRILPRGHKSRSRLISYHIINSFGRTTAWWSTMVPRFSKNAAPVCNLDFSLSWGDGSAGCIVLEGKCYFSSNSTALVAKIGFQP